MNSNAFRFKTCNSTGLFGAVVLAGLAGNVSTARAAFSYTVQDLGVVGTDQASYGFGVNANGLVAGESDPAGGSRAAVSTGGATLTGLTTFRFRNGTTSSVSDASARAVNGSGIAVGFATPTGNASTFGFTVNASASSPTLNQMPSFGGGFTRALGINSTGTVVGDSTYNNTLGFAYKWTAGATSLTPLDLNGPASTGLGDTQGGAFSVANAINSANQIVGQATSVNGDAHGFLYSGTKMYDLKPVSLTGGLGSGVTNAEGINDSGRIVGQTTAADGNTDVAFVYASYTVNTGAANGSSLNGQFTAIGTLGGNSDAHAINGTGQVVGDSNLTDGSDHAFVYDSANGLQDLNGLVSAGSAWQFETASAINDAGQITGTGLIGGVQHAFLLSPTAAVPEPAGLVVGIVTMSRFLARRRSR